MAAASVFLRVAIERVEGVEGVEGVAGSVGPRGAERLGGSR